MNNSCEFYRIQIADLLAGDLSPADSKSVETHLENCPDCSRYHQDLLNDDSLLTDFVESVDGEVSRLEGVVLEIISGGATSADVSDESSRDRRVFSLFRSTPMKIAAALVVLAGIVAVVSLLNRSGESDVVWAEALQRVADTRDFICRVTQNHRFGFDSEMVRYQSAKYGTRVDVYRNGRLMENQYLKPESNILVTLRHRYKTYYRFEMTDLMMGEMLTGDSVREMTDFFRQYEFSEIGEKIFDGVVASGIEIKNPEGSDVIFEEYTIRLWVDVDTNWPVRIDMEAEANQGKVRGRIIYDEFQWNPPLTEADFEFEIPDDYQLIAEIEAPQADESSAVEGLRKYGELTGDRYPSVLKFATAIFESENVIARRRDEGSLPDNVAEDWSKIHSTCAFFAKLLKEERDAMYYGNDVDARDYDKVLLRWRLDDGQYRVIYGDLRAETVSRERLEELEESR